MENKKVKKILERSKQFLNNNEKLKSLMGDVKNRIEEVSINENERKSFVNQLQMIIRMIQAHIKGKYRSFSFQTLLLLVFCLVYFITPVDLVPDFIPALGFADDISIIYMVLRSISVDIERYKVWETS